MFVSRGSNKGIKRSSRHPAQPLTQGAQSILQCDQRSLQHPVGLIGAPREEGILPRTAGKFLFDRIVEQPIVRALCMIPTHAACAGRAISPEYAHQLRPGCRTAKHSPCPAGMSRSKKTAGHRLLIPRSVCAEHRTDKSCRGKSDAPPACCSIVAFSCGLVLRCMETSAHKHTGRTGTQKLAAPLRWQSSNPQPSCWHHQGARI